MRLASIMLWAVGGLSTIAYAEVSANERVAVSHNAVAFEFVDDRGRVLETFPTSTGGSVEVRQRLRLLDVAGQYTNHW